MEETFDCKLKWNPKINSNHIHVRSYLLAQKLWILLFDFDNSTPNFSTNNFNLRNLSFIVLSHNIPGICTSMGVNTANNQYFGQGR